MIVFEAAEKAVPISTLKPAEKVLATNTKTGKTQAETITAVLVHHDTDLYNLTIKAHRRTAVIDTTSSHLFWDAYLNKWVPANKLSKNEHLKALDGATMTVVGGTAPKQHDGWMWDLTVPGNNDHDFYVIAGNPGQSKKGDHAYYGLAEVTAVLVHNSGGMDGCSDAAYQGVLHIKDEVAKGNMSHDLGISDNELADYLDTYANSGTGQPLKGGGVGWYDSSRGVMIISAVNIL